jgi:hypothetical protein
MLTLILEIIGYWFLASVGTVLLYNGIKQAVIRLR